MSGLNFFLHHLGANILAKPASSRAFSDMAASKEIAIGARKKLHKTKLEILTIFQYGNQWPHIQRSYVDYETLGAKPICEPTVAYS